jgi:hypothetical protein
LTRPPGSNTIRQPGTSHRKAQCPETPVHDVPRHDMVGVAGFEPTASSSRTLPRRIGRCRRLLCGTRTCQTVSSLGGVLCSSCCLLAAFGREPPRRANNADLPRIASVVGWVGW